MGSQRKPEPAGLQRPSLPASLLNAAFVLAALVSLASEGDCVLFLVGPGYQLSPTVHLCLPLVSQAVWQVQNHV